MSSSQEKIISSPCVLAEAEQGEEIIFSWGRPAEGVRLRCPNNTLTFISKFIKIKYINKAKSLYY